MLSGVSANRGFTVIVLLACKRNWISGGGLFGVFKNWLRQGLGS